MKSISSLAVVAALLVAGGATADPALAQKKKKQPEAAAASTEWKAKITKEEAVALKPLETAVNAKDWAAAQAALPAAEAGAKSADARFFVAQFIYLIGSGTNNAALQTRGLDAMIASGGGDPTRQATLYKAQGQMAAQAKDYAKAEAAYARYAQLAPNDPEAATFQTELKFLQGKHAEVVPAVQQMIRQREAAGQQVPETLYQLGLQSASNAKMWPEATSLARTLVAKYPNQKNWRNALLLFRRSSPQGPALLDMLRLMRATKTLDSSDEYLAYADLAARGRFYSEARGVLEEGFASGKLARSNRDASAILTEVGGRIAGDLPAIQGLEPRARSGANGELSLQLAEGYYGHGQYAKATEFYRLALQKGGVDASHVNSRLGMALALAGQRAEAETALKAVTGPRSALASYWLLWLGQRA
jgi:hypothetical protein